jgi:hypothetical protein
VHIYGEEANAVPFGSVMCTILISRVKIACERDDARLRFVEPTDLFLLATLPTALDPGSDDIGDAYEYIELKPEAEDISTEDRFATKTCPEPSSRTGSFGALE